MDELEELKGQLEAEVSDAEEALEALERKLRRVHSDIIAREEAIIEAKCKGIRDSIKANTIMVEVSHVRIRVNRDYFPTDGHRARAGEIVLVPADQVFRLVMDGAVEIVGEPE